MLSKKPIRLEELWAKISPVSCTSSPGLLAPPENTGSQPSFCLPPLKYHIIDFLCQIFISFPYLYLRLSLPDIHVCCKLTLSEYRIVCPCNFFLLLLRWKSAEYLLSIAWIFCYLLNICWKFKNVSPQCGIHCLQLALSSSRPETQCSEKGGLSKDVKTF